MVDMAEQSSIRERIDAIDGLRGLAIALVMYVHVFASLTPPGHQTVWLGDVEIHPYSVIANGWVGVNLFFIDSGFVLFLPFASGEKRIGSWDDVRRSYIRRAWRLLPLYYVVLVAGLALSWMRNRWAHVTPMEIVSCITFTFPFHASTWVPTSNAVLWSLGLEVWFSLLLPLFVLLISRFGMWRFLLAACAVATLTRLIAYHHSIGYVYLQHLNALADSLPGRIDNFAWGMAVAVAYRRGLIAKLRPALAGAAAFVGAMLVWYATSQWDVYYFSRQGLWAPIGCNILTNAGLALLLVGVLGSRGLLKRTFEILPLRWAGIRCYSLYLVHGMLLPFLIGHRSSVGYGLGFVMVSVGISALTFRLIEKPTMNRGR